VVLFNIEGRLMGSMISMSLFANEMGMLITSRLRTLPFLPPHKRPDVITSKSGREIVVNKVKVEDKEKILKRGQVSSPLLGIKSEFRKLGDLD